MFVWPLSMFIKKKSFAYHQIPRPVESRSHACYIIFEDEFNVSYIVNN